MVLLSTRLRLSMSHDISVRMLTKCIIRSCNKAQAFVYTAAWRERAGGIDGVHLGVGLADKAQEVLLLESHELHLGEAHACHLPPPQHC